MKLNLIRNLALLVAVVFLYTACKKNVIPALAKTPAADYKILSSQIASGLYKSLTGGYGGININDGISSPKTATINHKPFMLNSVNPVSLCGFVVDTAFQTKFNVHDTTKTIKGSFHFVYNCDAGILNGYTVNENYTAADSGAHFTDYNSVTQNYVVKALDNTYKLVSMDGSSSVDIQNTFYVTPDPRIGRGDQGAHVLSSAYVLTGLKVDFTSGTAEITTGIATFTTSTYDENANTAIDGLNSFLFGTIQFLGNHKAKISYNGFNPPLAFLVDLLTGTATKL
jgi:hypothetical protein